MQDALILCRFLHFCSVLVLFGLCFCRHVIFVGLLNRGDSSPGDVRLNRILRWLAALGLLTGLTWLLLTAASMGGNWQEGLDPQTLLLVLGNTFFGHVWSWHLGLNALLLTALLFALPAAWRLSLSTLLLVTLAPVGHGAMFDGGKGLLLILNQAVHLLAVSTWLGALVLLMLLARARDTDKRGLLLRFSGIGYGLVAAIILTGLINVRALSGALWPSPAFAGFGLILSIKLATVLCMLALALFNRLVLLDPQRPIGILKLSIAVECLFGFAAVAAVSLLGTLPPVLTG
ncbi:copper homeostasis membrane protein CopD [Pseudomonas sp. Pseusp122]|uniref:copper homeostasis membrane protein CopD n=1 Tax=unclassified Pseudomonas TaxID=196821 RepID=UPI0039A494A7